MITSWREIQITALKKKYLITFIYNNKSRSYNNEAGGKLTVFFRFLFFFVFEALKVK